MHEAMPHERLGGAGNVEVDPHHVVIREMNQDLIGRSPYLDGVKFHAGITRSQSSADVPRAVGLPKARDAHAGPLPVSLTTRWRGDSRPPIMIDSFDPPTDELWHFRETREPAQFSFSVHWGPGGSGWQTVDAKQH